MANAVSTAALAFPQGCPDLCTCDLLRGLRVIFVAGHFGGLKSRLELAFEEQDAKKRLPPSAKGFDAS
jgi:hypothetical protein